MNISYTHEQPASCFFYTNTFRSSSWFPLDDDDDDDDVAANLSLKLTPVWEKRKWNISIPFLQWTWCALSLRWSWLLSFSKCAAEKHFKNAEDLMDNKLINWQTMLATKKCQSKHHVVRAFKYFTTFQINIIVLLNMTHLSKALK